MKLYRNWGAIDDIIEAALAQAEPLTRQHQIRVSVEDELPVVRVDARAVAEVIYTLIDNASKYAPEGTRVTVGAKSVDGYVRITVADEGPGIPLDEQNRLFQRFFRSRTVREQAGGLGLGLSICRAIVHAQGGDITLESTPGRGTSVHFTLPKARHLAEEAED